MPNFIDDFDDEFRLNLSIIHNAKKLYDAAKFLKECDSKDNVKALTRIEDLVNEIEEETNARYN